MTPERFRQIEDLYHTARERDGEARAAFLVQACQGDRELQSELESLLVHEGRRLELPAIGTQSGMPANMQLDRETQLGPYRIEALLGAGGMGTVYRATDTRLGRPVAIKIVAKRFVERFDREARAISALNHPHICTLYDIGPDYLVMEYIEGRALSTPIPVEQVIKYALQVAGALDAAHAKGIVHRDLKPANILITIGGEAKVLDFGVAQYAEKNEEAGNEGRTRDMLTQPGTAVGTVAYMSPEQVRGQPVDGRSDLWSLGVILCELLTGMRPFERPTSGMILEAILTSPAVPVRPQNPQVTPELERIVLKLLDKNPEKRYQTAAQLLDDLRELPRKSEHRQYSYRIAAAVVAVATLTLGILLWKIIQARPLTDKDVLVLADFTNSTGDPVFDTTLREALSIQIEQSPFLKILSDDGVRVDLRLMGRAGTERITNDIAREICQRENDAATIGGSIANLGRRYAITLQANNCQTGDTLAREQVEAPDKEHVLEAVSKASSGMRHKLGESLNSIQKLQPPADRVTTASLQAFQVFAQGVVSFRRGAFLEAVPLFRRATELDPDFATAWNYLGISYQGSGQAGPLMTECLTRAFLLRDRGTERERLMNAAHYYLFVTSEWNKALEVTELWSRTYPRDIVAYNDRGVAHGSLGELDDALRDYQAEYRIEPRNAIAHGNLVVAYVQLERYEEAREVAETVLASDTDEAGPHEELLWMALIQGDRLAAEQQIRWFAGKPEEYEGLELRARAAVVRGRLQEADELFEQSSALRQQHGVERTPFSSGPAAALFGSCGRIRTLTDAVVLALCGDAAQSAEILHREEKAATNRQSDMLMNAIRLPMLRAASALKHDHPDQAITILRPVMNYERGRPNVVYLRGLSYLHAGRGADAAAEFQKIIDHKGQTWGPFYAASYVGLARAAGIAGENARARIAYRDFLTLWQDADPGIPILTQARQEYARLSNY